MSLMPQILKGMGHRNQLIRERDIINKKISVLTNCTDTLRFIQKIQDKHRLSERKISRRKKE